METAISNLDRKIIKKYDYISQKQNFVGFYYGTSDTRVNRMELMKDIVRQFKKDIGTDAPQINAALEGKV